MEQQNLDQAVRREIVLEVDRASAWSRLADAEGLRSWLAEEVDLEIRPGARGRMRVDGAQRMVEVETVQPLRRLGLIWRERDGEPSLVEITLDEVPEGTRMIVVEMPLVALRALAVQVEREGSDARGPQMLAVAA